MIRQFARRDQHDRARSEFATLARSGGQSCQQGKAEGEGLARSCATFAENIMTIESVIDGGELNRKRVDNAVIGECAHDRARKSEIGK